MPNPLNAKIFLFGILHLHFKAFIIQLPKNFQLKKRIVLKITVIDMLKRG
jgi:hypothetical protein